jgi:RNA polymerase sigma factor (sigma-70 family)
MPFYDENKTDKLIRQCLKNDEKAWEIFIEKYSSLIYSSILKKANRLKAGLQGSEIDEIFQEIVVSIFAKRKLDTITNKTNIVPWIIAVCFNQTVSYLKKRSFLDRSISLDELIDGGDKEIPAINNLSEKTDTLSKIEGEKVAELIDNVICEFSPQERIVFELSVIFGKTRKEISEILKMDYSAVSTLIVRTKEKIKGEIEKNIQ